MGSNEVVNELKDIIENWKAASRRVNQLENNTVNAKRELQTAEEKLAMWLLPTDSEEGEKFSVWYGDSLISVSELENGYEVSIRKRGKSLMV